MRLAVFTELDNTRKPHENLKEVGCGLEPCFHLLYSPTDVLYKDIFWGNEGEYFERKLNLLGLTYRSLE